MFLLNFLNSCKGGKTLMFLEQCQKKRFEQNEKYCLSNIQELKDNLSKSSSLHYIGSDVSFHYWEYYYNKTTKMSMKFKLPINEYSPSETLIFKDSNIWSDGYPVSLSDL